MDGLRNFQASRMNLDAPHGECDRRQHSRALVPLSPGTVTSLKANQCGKGAMFTAPAEMAHDIEDHWGRNFARVPFVALV